MKLLPRDSRLFIPDLPGYGSSSPSQTAHDKGTIGRAILASLATLLSVRNRPASPVSQPVILIGHDRGARVIHRLAVDYNTAPYTDDGNITLPILGITLMDIVPTLTQWTGMSNPLEATAFYHWPFLANVDLATAMIAHVGPDVFVRNMIQRGLGRGERALSSFHADDAMEVYQRPFRQLESVVRASCQDYQAGAGVDVEMQRRDLERGDRIRVPVLVVYGRGLGGRFDVRGSWGDGGWVEDGVRMDFLEMGEGVGHFVAEEDAEGVVGGIEAWMKRVV